MYGQPGQRLAAGPGDDRMVASHGAQVNAAGWVILGVLVPFARRLLLKIAKYFQLALE